MSDIKEKMVLRFKRAHRSYTKRLLCGPFNNTDQITKSLKRQGFLIL